MPVPAPTPMQFDLFNYSREIALRNDVIQALQQADAAAARQAWQVLQAQFAQDESLPGLAVLLSAIEPSGADAFTDPAAVEQARGQLCNPVDPAARRHLGACASAWLGARWQAVAERAKALPYHPDHPNAHAGALWLRAGQWQAAADAVERIPSWRRIPAPLAWMLQARLALHGLHVNWGLLAELAWLAPGRLESACQTCSDPLLKQLLDKFERDFANEADDKPLRWFPAWLLTERPQLAPQLALAQEGLHTAPEAAMRLLLEILGLERQGRQSEWIAHRKTLKGMHPLLFTCFMRTR